MEEGLSFFMRWADAPHDEKRVERIRLLLTKDLDHARVTTWTQDELQPGNWIAGPPIPYIRHRVPADAGPGGKGESGEGHGASGRGEQGVQTMERAEQEAEQKKYAPPHRRPPEAEPVSLDRPLDGVLTMTRHMDREPVQPQAVSYTHLTLPPKA